MTTYYAVVRNALNNSNPNPDDLSTTGESASCWFHQRENDSTNLSSRYRIAEERSEYAVRAYTTPDSVASYLKTLMDRPTCSLHRRRLLSDARLQPKVVITVPERAECGDSTTTAIVATCF